MTYPFYKYFCFILTLLTSVAAYGQDPVFSQFYAHPLELNPALAGNSGGTRIGLNYRNQWNGLSSDYKTYAVSADQYLFGYNSGIGISLMADEAGQGIYRTINGEFSYSYQIEMKNDTKIKMGVQLGFNSVALDYDKLLFIDQIDPINGATSPGGLPYPTNEAPPEFTNRTLLDLGFGAVINNENFYAGLAMKHLNRPDLNFYTTESNTKRGLPIRLTAMAGYRIPIGIQSYGRKSNYAILPNILFVKQSSLGQVNLGAILEMKSFNAGLYYRNGFKNPDAIIVSAGFDTGQFKFGYSYDATVSGLGFNTGGTHELSLSVVFYQDNGSKYSDCTKIFR